MVSIDKRHHTDPVSSTALGRPNIRSESSRLTRLDPIRSFLDGGFVARQRVLGEMSRCSSMAQDEGPSGFGGRGHGGAGRTLMLVEANDGRDAEKQGKPDRRAEIDLSRRVKLARLQGIEDVPQLVEV